MAKATGRLTEAEIQARVDALRRQTGISISELQRDRDEWDEDTAVTIGVRNPKRLVAVLAKVGAILAGLAALAEAVRRLLG